MAFIARKKSMEDDVAQYVAETCEQIISEMGAELHDDLIQRLSIFRLYLDRLERADGNKEEIDALTIKMRTEFEQVVQVIRNISRRLLPANMDGELLDKTIEILCQNMEYPGSCHIHFENTGAPYRLDAQTERYIFRIVQELIHNALKHSSAWHIWVRMIWDEEVLILEVEDDGTAFSRIADFIKQLKRKNNTLKLRSGIIGANLRYLEGEKGLLARLTLTTSEHRKIPAL